MAASMGSGLSTIPGPPPYGRSSTVRCTSVVCARGSSVPTFNRPRSTARPTMPNPSAPEIISGKRVTTSIFIERLCSLHRPVHQNQTRREINLAQVLWNRGYPVLAFPLHHHHRTRRRVDEVAHLAELHPFQVAHCQAQQVRLVILALTGRRQVGARHLYDRTPQSRRSFAILDALEPRYEPVGVRTALHHSPGDALTR